MNHRVEISYKTIVFFVFFVLLLWFLFYIRDIIFYLFVSFIFMSALRPYVEKLEKLKIPRPLAIAIIYIIFIALLSFMVSVIIPPLVSETVSLIKNISPEGKIPVVYQELLIYIKNLNFENIKKISPYGGNVLDIFKTALSVFGGIISGLSLLVLTFYLLLERKHLEKIIEGQVGEEKGKRWIKMLLLVEDRLGAWVRGQFLLCLIIGVMSYIGLILLGISYALPLSIIAGILEIVPIIGPIVSAIPAILAALLVSPGLALAVAALYFLIQQAENHIIVPNIMSRVVGLRPVITIIALMIGVRLMGITGALFAIPVVLVLQTILQEYLREK